MPQYKIVNLACSYFALLVVIATHSLSSSSANAISLSKSSSARTLLSISQVDSLDLLKQHNHQFFVKLSNNQLNNLIHKPNQENYSLIADLDLAEVKENAKESPGKLLKFVSLSFFVLVFVPLGIFYPLFLFYRKLLIKPDEFNYPLKEHYQSDLNEVLSPSETGIPAETNTNEATVSKLQIAFSPIASHLRHELGQLSSGDEFKNIVELMRQTVGVLIAQAGWTHVNYSSVTLPFEEIEVEFDLVSYRERSKFTSKKLNLISRNSETNSHQKTNENYRYVVITLILCTTHKQPLFNKILTKEQLVNELIELSKMRKDHLLNFELLWNPQEESKYISNEQLLTEYSEMIRLL